MIILRALGRNVPEWAKDSESNEFDRWLESVMDEIRFPPPVEIVSHPNVMSLASCRPLLKLQSSKESTFRG
jgi:hypothetical protein